MSRDGTDVVGTRTVDARQVAGLADLLGADDVDVSVGAPLPALWHWVALARWAPLAELGADGHPHDGTLPLRDDLPRRMFAGGEVTVHRPLRIGAEVHVERTVEDVRDTQGRSGPLRFVTVRDLVHDGADGPAVEERLDLVYRAAASPPAGPADGDAATLAGGSPGTSGLRWSAGGAGPVATFVAVARLLQRFSALTCNAHRIHYDHPYATGVEGYAGLVVHGPLLAIALAEAARRRGGPVRRVAHRGRAALLAHQVAQLGLVDEGDAGVAVTARLPARPDADPGRAISEITAHHHLEESS